jgi:hypothetical protein
MLLGGPSQYRQTVRLALAAILAGFILFGLVELGRAYWTLRTPGWHEWADFTVPADTVPLNADVRIYPGKVAICNLGAIPWKHTLVQITGGYLAEVEILAPKKCKELQFRDFQTNSWKRMPPSPNFVIGSVEILTNVSAKGYIKWPPVSHESDRPK